MSKRKNKEVEVLQRQSLADIAIQQTGNLDAIFKIAENNDLSVTDTLTAGTILECNIINNKQVAEYFRVNNLKPATYITREEILAITGRLEGIDYWTVSKDFIVS